MFSKVNQVILNDTFTATDFYFYSVIMLVTKLWCIFVYCQKICNRFFGNVIWYFKFIYFLVAAEQLEIQLEIYQNSVQF